MKLSVIYAFMLLAVYLCRGYCDSISFQEYCLQDHRPDPLPINGKRSSDSIVMNKLPVNGTWYQPNLNCSVTFSTENNYLLFLTFSNISLRNSSMDNLIVIYNDGQSSHTLWGQQVCSNENCEGLKFDSGKSNNLTLKFISANATVPQNLTGFRAHYTAYNLVNSKGACINKNQFLCDNGHCISMDLKCDGHNNCGDRSDETECHIPVYYTVWGIVVIVIAIFTVIVFVPLFCCLSTYGTRNIVQFITVSQQATPLLPTTDCGEMSGLLTSSDVITNYGPGTSYERSNSFSYGTSQQPEPSTGLKHKKKSSFS